jgi:phage shock protein PspC (stress-responsive transcriptional regulator)
VAGEGVVPKRLVRDTRRGIIGGVAAGFGLYLDVDPVLVRLALVLLAFAHGLGVLLYLAGWLLMPRAETLEAGTEPAGSGEAPPPDASPGVGIGSGVGSAAEAGVEALRDAGSRFASEARAAASGVRAAAPASESVQAAVGALLVAVGGVLLAHNLGWLHWPWWLSVSTLWPIALVALGMGLIAKSRRPATTQG